MVTVLIAFLVLALLGSLLLYAAIESETANTQILDREAAEEEAKRRGGIHPRERFGTRNARQSDRENDTGSPDWGESTGREDSWKEPADPDDSWEEPADDEW